MSQAAEADRVWVSVEDPGADRGEGMKLESPKMDLYFASCR